MLPLALAVLSSAGARAQAPSPNPATSLRAAPAWRDEVLLGHRAALTGGLSFTALAQSDAGEASGTAAEPAASDSADGHTDVAKSLQNPVADLISFPLQFNYDEKIGPKDAGRYTLNVQPVVPINLTEHWNLISRTILPVIYQESPADGVDYAFGLGDTVQSAFLSPKDPVGGWILGVGPVALLPTGTSPEIRSEQLGLGPTAVALRQTGGLTFGALANHIWSVTDPEENKRVNATFLQPFCSYTWPSATTLALNAESTYDWTEDELTLPLNLQLAQLVKLGKRLVQLQIGGRYYADRPSGGPEWGARFALIFVFPR